MRRPASAPTLDPNEPHSAVYLAGRREWNERYGSYIAQRDSWRRIAFCSLGVTFVAVAGLAWMASQNHVVPYVIEVNRLGDTVAAVRAEVSAPIDARRIKAQLARWIVDVRTVYTDIAAQRGLIGEAYAWTNRNGAALTYLNEWFAANNPLERAKQDTTAVAVQSVLPLPGGNAWRVEWTEEKRSRDGRLEERTSWQATISIGINPPADDATILANPNGLYVESVEWSARG